MGSYHLVSNEEWIEALFQEYKKVELRPNVGPMRNMRAGDTISLRWGGYLALCRIQSVAHYATYEAALVGEKVAKVCPPWCRDFKLAPKPKKGEKPQPPLEAALAAHTRPPYRGTRDELFGIVAIRLFLTHFIDDLTKGLQRVLEDDDPDEPPPRPKWIVKQEEHLKRFGVLDLALVP